MRNGLTIDYSMKGVDLDVIDAALPSEGLCIHIDNVCLTNEKGAFSACVTIMLPGDSFKLFAPVDSPVWARMLDNQSEEAYEDRMIAYTQVILKCLKHDRQIFERYARNYNCISA